MSAPAQPTTAAGRQKPSILTLAASNSLGSAPVPAFIGNPVNDPYYLQYGFAAGESAATGNGPYPDQTIPAPVSTSNRISYLYSTGLTALQKAYNVAPPPPPYFSPY